MATDDDLRRRRLAVLEVHFQSEVDHDWDACLGTFKDVPRYEIVPTGGSEVHEGRDAVRACHVAQRRAFPTSATSTSIHVADDDTIVTEFDLLGTNTGPFAEPRADGQALPRAGVAVFTFDGDRITSERVYLGVASLVQQIGRAELLPLVGVEGFAAARMR
ncbi:MAG: ester cyclase [Candidatus Binatia bacterium]